MAKYFTIDELVRSHEAASRGIDNTPPADVKMRLNALIDNLLDPLRERWGRPITVNSGFRCPALNRAVGGAAGSQHIRGEAADITAGNQAENRRLFELIVRMGQQGDIAFDQLIDERGYRWLHVSYSRPNRGQILHL